MRAFIIASSEYEANWPDMFLMDEEGNYYGVSEHSYAKIKNFPESIEYWRNATSSDAGRILFIDEVELAEEQMKAFDKITKEYNRLEEERPVFGGNYPSEKDYKTKKAYKQAVDKHMENYMQWLKDSGAMKLSMERSELWKDRTRMFLSFSKIVEGCISDNDNIKYL